MGGKMRFTWILTAFVLFSAPFAAAQTPSFDINKQKCDIEKALADHARGRLDNDLQRDFHDILMVNELSGGCGALQFTDAKMDSHTNGFSFGLSQFDLATRPKDSLSTLNKIIACSRKEHVSPGISDADLTFLKDNAHFSTYDLKGDKNKWDRFYRMRPAIEAALQSNCGRQYIENSYIAEMRGFEKKIAPWWQVIRTRNPATTLAERFYKLYELDLENVFGGTEGFRKVVNLEEGIPCGRLCEARIVPLFKLDGPVSVSDLIRYMFTTNCYGYIPQQTRQQDALRRLNTVLGKIDLQSLPLDESDKRYLTTEFANILARNKKRFPGSPDEHLRALVAVANAGASVSGDDTLMDEASLKAAVKVCSKK
ncbi:hypothetical protein FHX06_001497 [Rhizobium sp. BK512]|uniref:hypothetical protein n=1 Tax=Rhizobium sp. BK512 TaxID=2587010 RepID=UPI00183302F0|nr:hypothetical protein [Rhizobium sp. BK512]MBB3560186.1 hypothetical protein [Rhizobium sp. BK512]